MISHFALSAKVWLIIGFVAYFSFTVESHAKTKEKEKTEGPTVTLPTFVVIGTRIPSSWLEVAYECKGPLPIDRIKKAWISKVGRGTPADDAGLKTGDKLLAFDGRDVDSLTGLSLYDSLKRERDSGTRLELVVQTKDAEKCTVVIVFK